MNLACSYPANRLDNRPNTTRCAPFGLSECRNRTFGLIFFLSCTTCLVSLQYTFKNEGICRTVISAVHFKQHLQYTFPHDVIPVPVLPEFSNSPSRLQYAHQPAHPACRLPSKHCHRFADSSANRLAFLLRSNTSRQRECKNPSRLCVDIMILHKNCPPQKPSPRLNPPPPSTRPQR